MSEDFPFSPRMATGAHDSSSRLIHEGDIVRHYHNEHYGFILGWVFWDAEAAAFRCRTIFPDGAIALSYNLEGSSAWLVFGSVYDDPAPGPARALAERATEIAAILEEAPEPCRACRWPLQFRLLGQAPRLDCPHCEDDVPLTETLLERLPLP